tara:strand:+ start:42 stop:956 length:915 start_codon:yes stop_codon:yes gene_type:complete
MANKKKQNVKNKIKKLLARASKDGVIKAKELKGIKSIAKDGGIPLRFIQNKANAISSKKGVKIRKGAQKKLQIQSSAPVVDTPKPKPPKVNETGVDAAKDSVFSKGQRVKVKGKGPYNKFLGYDKDGKARPLTAKINEYKEYLSGDTKKSQQYLSELKKSAVTRMEIDPKEYGRKGRGKFKDLPTLAEKYDKNSKKLTNKLSRPLRKFLKLDRDNPLNNFKFNKKGEVKKIKFSESKMKSFVSNESDYFNDIREAATGLGVKSPKESGMSRVSSALGRINKRGTSSNVSSVKSKLYKRPDLVKG